jgi:hypothetical protein
MIRYTPEGHADYDPLLKAVDKVEEVAKAINETVRQEEKVNKNMLPSIYL